MRLGGAGFGLAWYLKKILYLYSGATPKPVREPTLEWLLVSPESLLEWRTDRVSRQWLGSDLAVPLE